MTKKNKTGRPSTRTTLQEEQIFKILQLGLSERTATEFAGVKWSTYMSWKERELEFATKILQKKANARTFVASKLWEQIQGEQDAKGNWTTRPNITAMIFWLKTRAKEEFTEVQEVRHEGLPKGFDLNVI